MHSSEELVSQDRKLMGCCIALTIIWKEVRTGLRQNSIIRFSGI